MCKKTGTANDNKEYESVSQILVKMNSQYLF